MDFNFLFTNVSTGGGEIYLDWILTGIIYTASISIVSFIIALILGTKLGVARTLEKDKGIFLREIHKSSLSIIKLKYIKPNLTKDDINGALANWIFEVIRSVPFIAQVFIWYFVMPALLFPDLVREFNPTAITYIAGTISLSIFMAGRIAGHMYTALEALPPEQAKASQALGFTHKQAMKLFLVPQAFRNSLPPITSEAMSTVKNSAVIGSIGLFELSKQATQLIDYTSQVYESFTLIVLGYLLLNAIVYFTMKHVEKRFAL